MQLRLAELAGNLTDRLARTRRAADAPGNLREYNPHFVGREKQLIELHEALIRDCAVGVITAVNGFGGQGKTEFAVTYAHSRADSYPGGLWVLAAEGRAELLPLFGELTGDARLGIPLSAGPQETAAQRGLRVLARMEALAHAAENRDPDGGAACLVILDNVSDPRLLDFPPATKEADTAAAHEIARELGGFTLAVESVAIYLGLHPDIRPAAYLARLRAEGSPGTRRRRWAISSGVWK